MCREVMSIYCSSSSNNNNELVGTFYGKNVCIVLLNIVVRIETSWLQMVYSTWSPDGVCEIAPFNGNGV